MSRPPQTPIEIAYERLYHSALAFREIAEFLLTTIESSDLDSRDRSNPACPRVDAARRPHPMDEIDFE